MLLVSKPWCTIWALFCGHLSDENTSCRYGVLTGLCSFTAEHSSGQNLSWGDKVDQSEGRPPGRAVQMHQKLSSPSRKKYAGNCTNFTTCCQSCSYPVPFLIPLSSLHLLSSPILKAPIQIPMQVCTQFFSYFFPYFFHAYLKFVVCIQKCNCFLFLYSRPLAEVIRIHEEKQVTSCFVNNSSTATQQSILFFWGEMVRFANRYWYMYFISLV